MTRPEDPKKSPGGKAISLVLSWNETMDTGGGTAAPVIAYVWTMLFTNEVWRHITGLNSSEGPEAPRLEYLANLIDAYLKGERRACRYLPRGYAGEVAIKNLEETLFILESIEGSINTDSWDYGKIHSTIQSAPRAG